MKKQIIIKCLVELDIPYLIKLSKRKTMRIHFDSSAILIINAPLLIKISSLE